MATVFRGPLISPARPPRPPAKDFPQQPNPALLAPVVVAPPNQNYDFPLAARRDSARARDSDFVNDLPRRLEGVFPGWHPEWPTPPKGRPKAVDSINGQPLRSLIQPRFRQSYWPSAARKDSPRAREEAKK